MTSAIEPGATAILLWGPPADLPLASVATALTRAGVPFFLVDQGRVLETSVELEGGEATDGWVAVGRQRCALGQVRAVYLRTYGSTEAEPVLRAGVDSAEWRHALAVDDALSAWLECTSARVINPFAAMASNGSKPYQLELIRAAGFDVPDTLVTTDPAQVSAFQARHGTLIYKSVSGIRSIVSRFGAEQQERLGDVANCPTQFQEYVAGTDFRVHVVGHEVFAHRITSDADDYRYGHGGSGDGGLAIEPAELPAPLPERCRALAQCVGLPVAGIDLRRSPDGRWYCFEVNPSPGFTFYDSDEDQPIAGAIARLLAQSPAIER